MTSAAFEVSLQNPAPPAGLAVPLQALWWAGRNEWDKAHAGRTPQTAPLEREWLEIVTTLLART